MTNADICQNFPQNQPAVPFFANNLPNPVFANQPIPDFPNQQMPHFRVRPIINQQQFNQQQIHQHLTGLVNQQNPNLQKFDPNRPIGY